MGERVTHDLAALSSEPSVVTIGVFDGVHTGHRMLLDRVVSRARRHGHRALAVTFDRHPAATVRPGTQPGAIQAVPDKVAALLAAGMDHVHVLTFDHAAAQQSATTFVQDVLAGPVQARHVLVGANFRFGRGASGDVDVLRRLGASHDFTVEGLELVDVDGQIVSSTGIRRALEAGNVAAAAAALGRDHLVRGTVVRGDGRGRSIGVPTANVQVTDRVIVPAVGVYATRVHVDDDVHPAVTNVGTRPTFDGVGITVEAHLLDVDEDLYGRRVAVEFVQRLRDEVRFDGVDALVAQIRDDIGHARRVLVATSGAHGGEDAHDPRP